LELVIKTFDQLSAGELYEILKARAAVFMLEQKIVCQDMDDVDYRAWHIFLQEKNDVKAYLRMYETDEKTVQIGRVLTTERKKGYGYTVMCAAIDTAKRRLKKQTVRLEAQSHAIGFYEKLGFQVTSEEFLDVGIPHVEMKFCL